MASRRLLSVPGRLTTTARTTTKTTASRRTLSTTPRLLDAKDAAVDPASSLPGQPTNRATAGLRTDMMTGEVVAREDIDPSLLQIDQVKQPRSIPPSSQLVFGRTFADHMLSIPWSSNSGWSAPKIHPYGPLSLDPSCTVFHYAPCLFEGMKAYKDRNGGIRLFRPDMNMKRMNSSAARLAFPTFNGDNLTNLIKRLIAIDSRWIPSEPGHSLYIRPTMIGTQASLGVSASSDVLLFTITSPVGPYYKTGFKPVSLLASTEHVRAWPGGTGGFKLGSNYAPGVVPQQKAAVEGYHQILWLFGEDHEVTEVGTMNLFVVIENDQGVLELITPPLNDMILPGVTRDSILQLARAHSNPRGDASSKLAGLPSDLIVSERRLTMGEIVDASRNGRLKEMFGAGTAAIVSPVESVGYKGQRLQIPVGQDGLGDVARAMLRQVTGIQLGEIEHEWSVLVEPFSA